MSTNSNLDSEIYKKGGELILIIDDMINTIASIREQYDAAQATSNSKELIKSMKKVNVPELRTKNNNLKTKTNLFLGLLK